MTDVEFEKRLVLIRECRAIKGVLTMSDEELKVNLSVRCVDLDDESFEFSRRVMERINS